MARGLNNGIAKILAILMVVAMMGKPVLADDNGVTLPQTGGEPVSVHLSPTGPDGLDASKRLQVFVGSPDPCCEHRIPMAGSYTLSEGTLIFLPAFGFDAGQDYVARVWTPQDEHVLHAFRLANKVATVPAAVTETYPSGKTIPENTLRFYIHFSVPMEPHVAFDHIKLRDASGTVDDAAFMKFKQELWNDDRTRLTVLIDPGRIKREVATNVDLGPALRAGQHYTLSVEGGWPSADGTSVLPTFSRAFTVSSALRKRPDVGLWQVVSPCVGTRQALEISLDRPFDRHLLFSKLRVLAKTGHRIEGEIEVAGNERVWRFVPNHPWSGTDVQLVAETGLEDVAGNNFHDLLDRTTRDQIAVPTSTDLNIDLTTCSE